MIIGKKKLTVITILDGVLGVGTSMKDNEQAHHCPFCHHPKKKLQINLNTQQFHCWVCNARGSRIVSLLRKLRADVNSIQRINDIYGEVSYNYNPNDDYPEKLELPKEFKQLHTKPKSINPNYNQAITYLLRRGINIDLIVRYNIGYCASGDYGGRIIIPSYDGNGELNYFIARSFYEDNKMKYKNPPVSRNVIMFENHINWSEPITLVEGGFDAFSVRRNVIPLLSKFILPKLKNKIKEMGVRKVNILLDPDAVQSSIKHAEYFLKNGIGVNNIILTESDAGGLGFEKVNKLIKESKETKWDDLILTKISNL
jgi:transcription elongation factor Elf1